MKKKSIYYLIAIFFICSCADKTTSEVSDVVSDYEQTVGNTKIDLNLKVNSVVKIKDYFVKDSLERYKKYFETSRSNLIAENKRNIEFCSNDTLQDINLLAKKYKGEYKPFEELVDMVVFCHKTNILIWKNELELYSTNCKGTSLEDDYNRIKDYEQRPNEILYTIYEVNYKINNPILNNVKQEINKFYFIKGDPINAESNPLKIVGTANEL